MKLEGIQSSSARSQELWSFGGATGIVFGARLTGAVVMLGVQLALAHVAGAEQLGMFFLATSLATVASVIAAGGYPNIVIKVVGRGCNSEKRTADLARVAIFDISFASLGILGLITLCWVFTTGSTALLIASAAIPVLALGRLLNAFAVAQGRPLLANLPDLLGRPLIIGLGFALLGLSGIEIDAASAASLYLMSVIITVGVLSFAMVRSGFSLAERSHLRLRRVLRKMALPLMVVSALSALIGDVAIVTSGVFLSTSELGVFALSLKVALLIGFLIQTVHQVGMPKIAAAYRAGQTDSLRAEVIRTNRFAVAFTVAAGLCIAVLTTPFQAFLGDDFSRGGVVLVGLVGMQIGRAYLGPSVPALVLVSANRLSSMLSFAMAVLLFAGMALLAPRYGQIGAALAMIVATLTWYASAALVASRNGLSTAGLGCWTFKQQFNPSTAAKL